MRFFWQVLNDQISQGYAYSQMTHFCHHAVLHFTPCSDFVEQVCPTQHSAQTGHWHFPKDGIYIYLFIYLFKEGDPARHPRIKTRFSS